MRRPLVLLPLVLLLSALTACGEHSDPLVTIDDPLASSSTPGPAPTPADPADYERPPRLMVRAGDTTYDTWQGSFCWSHPTGGGESSGLCSDSIAPGPDDLPDVGSPASVEVTTPIVVTAWDGYVTRDGPSCAASVMRTPVDDLTSRWTLAAPPGDYTVDLMGRVEAGEVPGSFRWTAAPLAEPLAFLHLRRNADNEGGESGFQLVLAGMAPVSGRSSVTVTVTAADGTTSSFRAAPARGTCPQQGYLAFGPRGDRDAARVDELGPTPYDVAVELELDGTSYDATGSWAGEGDAPGADVVLTSVPELPGQ